MSSDIHSTNDKHTVSGFPLHPIYAELNMMTYHWGKCISLKYKKLTWLNKLYQPVLIYLENLFY